MSLKKIKSSLRRTGIIALVATTLGNFTPAKSQEVEKGLYEETDKFPAQYPDERLCSEENIDAWHAKYMHKTFEDINDGQLVKNDLYTNKIASKEYTQQKGQNKGRGYDKPLEITWWGKGKLIDVGFGLPKSLFESYKGKVFEISFSIPYLPPEFGIGTALGDGDYGKKQISILPIYIEFPLYIEYAVPPGRVYKSEDGQSMIHYDYPNQDGEWGYATMLTSFFVSGRSWVPPKVGERIFRASYSWQELNLSFREGDYIKTGINHTFFHSSWIFSIGLEGGLFLEKSRKTKDSFYLSIDLGLGSRMGLKLR